MSYRKSMEAPGSVEGLSPVIGVLLMLLITILLGAIIGTFIVS